MRYTAFLRNRDLLVLDDHGTRVFGDFLYRREDTVTADRVLKMYGYKTVSDWREHPRLPGLLVCEVEGEQKKVR